MNIMIISEACDCYVKAVVLCYSIFHESRNRISFLNHVQHVLYFITQSKANFEHIFLNSQCPSQVLSLASLYNFVGIKIYVSVFMAKNIDEICESAVPGYSNESWCYVKGIVRLTYRLYCRSTV